jgi:hypothetical protein
MRSNDLSNLRGMILPVLTGITSGMIGLLFSCSEVNETRYVIERGEVIVDGLADDWEQIEGNLVDSRGHLWIGQDMIPENWKGKDDLSFQWRSCHSRNRLYFLFEVLDDSLVEPAGQPNSFLNDCIEIMLDPDNIKGPRFTDTGQGKHLHGYEMHFLPASPNHVFLNDSLAPMYPMELAQDSLFISLWKGEIASTRQPGGYILEIGFEVPGFDISPGRIIGLDVNVCDDDGKGRKSLMIWSGTEKEFWLTMDEYPGVVLE